MKYVVLLFLNAVKKKKKIDRFSDAVAFLSHFLRGNLRLVYYL